MWNFEFNILGMRHVDWLVVLQAHRGRAGIMEDCGMVYCITLCKVMPSALRHPHVLSSHMWRWMAAFKPIGNLTNFSACASCNIQ